MNEYSKQKRIAVIGGGVTGLAAAHHVRKLAPELDVRLFESGSRLGGVIRTIRKDGFLIEGAADNFITTSPSAIELCRDVGLGDELIGTNQGPRGAMVLSRGKLEPIPSGFMVMAPSRIWPLLATRILSPMGKLRSGAEVLIPRRRREEDESLKSFVCRRFGREMFERLVQPLVGGIYTADPNRLSVAATMPRFLEMEREHGSLIRGMLRQRRRKPKSVEKSGGARYSQFMTLAGGMSRLIDALGDQLPEDNVQFDSPVQDVVPNGLNWSLHHRDQWDDFDGVIVAAPAAAASQMLTTVDEPLSEEIGAIEYASCAVVSLAYRRDQISDPLEAFGFVVPKIEDHFILSCSFSSVKYDGRAPDGTVLMRVFIGGACQSGLLRMPDHELTELAHWELSKLLGVEGDPLMRQVNRQMHAMPQYHVGHNQRISRINDRLAAFPTLAVAGSAFGGVGVPSCIESGQKAAEQIVANMRDDSGIWKPQACEVLV